MEDGECTSRTKAQKKRKKKNFKISTMDEISAITRQIMATCAIHVPSFTERTIFIIFIIESLSRVSCESDWQSEPWSDKGALLLRFIIKRKSAQETRFASRWEHFRKQEASDSNSDRSKGRGNDYTARRCALVIDPNQSRKRWLASGVLTLNRRNTLLPRQDLFEQTTAVVKVNVKPRRSSIFVSRFNRPVERDSTQSDPVRSVEPIHSKLR